ncbi:hypothetical protein [Salidesulfovibrio onnuriiensis]|uniref:hypothetical protein n=1 Tax=Salidesulfovibrio onnuriiensis TaxID=2583823 RepID=UPI0011CA810C|nr:hypothetical protein [Salidesulfovibrio onnuriiensis]
MKLKDILFGNSGRFALAALGYGLLAFFLLEWRYTTLTDQTAGRLAAGIGVAGAAVTWGVARILKRRRGQ